MKKGSKKKKIFNLPDEFEKAIHLHQNGHLEQAKVIYKKIIRKVPSHPEALHMFGVLYSQTGNFDKAIELMRKSINSSSPVRPDYLFNLARAYYGGKHFDDAIDTYQKYFNFVSDDPEAFYLMGRVLQDKKDLKQAIVYYKRALEKSPERIDYLNSLGLTFHEQGDFEQALACYEKALSLQPNDFLVLNNLGLVLVEQNKFAAAADCFRHALSVRPEYAEAHYNLGRCLFKQDMFAAAAESFRNALKISPEYADAHYLLGNVLIKQQRFPEAIEILQQALSFKSDYPDAYVDLGSIYTTQGDLNKARSYFEKALAIEPDHTRGLLLLVSLQKGVLGDNILLRQENLYLKNELKDKQKIELAFALGKANADSGNHDKAFFYLAEGNRLKRKSFEYSISKDKILFDLIKHVYDESFVFKHIDEGNQDETPVFILGMPRSGTSLVEQILASHPEVHGAGELEDFQRVVLKLIGSSSLAEVFTKISNDEHKKFHEKIAAKYLSRIRELSSTARFITDKMPHNFMFIGEICLALPNAKIIHCLRDPMDNCFSIYKNFISEKHKYAFDLEELAHHYLFYQDLIRHWHDVFPGRIYDIKYENLINDQEVETRNLVKHCGLSWDDHCLSFYKTQRNVSTLSWTQVRKPIYKDSVQLWKKYEKHLDPLRSILFAENK